MAVENNPFQAPEISTSEAAEAKPESAKFVPALFAVIFAFAAAIGGLSIFFPAIRDFINPRFGWIGLILCLNPLIFLSTWLKSPTRQSLMAAAFITLSIGIINSVQLLIKPTVSIVENPFTDRLHSAWLWSVLPFVVAGLYLFIHAWQIKAQALSVGAGPASNG